MDNDNAQLESRVTALEAWKAQKTAQQISFPLDVQSVTILNDYFLSVISLLTFTNSSGGIINTILAKQRNKIYGILLSAPLVIFSADPTSDKLIIGADITTNQQGHFADGNRVFLQTTDTLPSPLDDTTEYYIINGNADGTVVQISSDGVTPIDITDAGTGLQYMSPAL